MTLEQKLNVTSLDELVEADSNEPYALVLDVIGLYVKTQAEMMEKIESGSRDLDYPQLEAQSHRLKSGSQMVGLCEVGRLCAEIETHSKEKRPEVTFLCQQLKQEMDLGLVELQSYREQLLQK